jgi:hypothetical protein
VPKRKGVVSGVERIVVADSMGPPHRLDFIAIRLGGLSQIVITLPQLN